ncbi:MAG TPA: hypothetical protein VGO90_16160 [Chthoniobacteraceae bacterium]|jgi:Tfp pilus assembly protein PilV|nr:hypothetical protein [Chthoniobacter sp.]HEV7869223.1 hypothetical protein [Chthoniobacteraceae bacterium]
MKRLARRHIREAGFWLLEAMLAVGIFSIGVIALGQCVNNCIVAVRMKQEDVRARLALSNRMAEIQAEAVALGNDREEVLRGAFEGMKLKQKRTPFQMKNEKNEDVLGIEAVTLQVSWKSEGTDQSRDLNFYVYRRQN